MDDCPSRSDVFHQIFILSSSQTRRLTHLCYVTEVAQMRGPLTERPPREREVLTFMITTERAGKLKARALDRHDLGDRAEPFYRSFVVTRLRMIARAVAG
jgi:hypothetical protein